MEKLCVEGTSLEEFQKAIDGRQVDVNEVFGNFKTTALIWAAENNKDSIISLLIEKGANVNAKNKYGESSYRNITTTVTITVIDVCITLLLLTLIYTTNTSHILKIVLYTQYVRIDVHTYT